MNNEEKILGLLEQVLEKQNALDRNQAVMEKRLNEVADRQGVLLLARSKTEDSLAVLERGQSRLEAELNAVKDQVQSTHEAVLRLELVEMPRIQTALDGMLANQERIERHEKEYHGV